MSILVDKEFMSSLKQSSAVVFRHKENTDIIEFIIKDRKGREIDREIYSYKNEYNSNITYACHSETNWGCTPDTWTTIIQQIKVNDKIKLDWQKDYHSNEHVKKAGLHADTLRLIIRRGKDYNKVLCFEVSTVICPQNSVRMIDPYASCLHPGI